MGASCWRGGFHYTPRARQSLAYGHGLSLLCLVAMGATMTYAAVEEAKYAEPRAKCTGAMRQLVPLWGSVCLTGLAAAASKGIEPDIAPPETGVAGF